MAKKRQMRDRVKSKQRPQKAGAAGAGDAGAGGRLPEVSSTRVQRKVAKSVRFLEKLQTTQSALAMKTQGVTKKGRRKGKGAGALGGMGAEELGLALGSLGSLKGALPEAQGLAAPPPAKKLTPKAKQRMIVHETKQLNAVLEHPVFKANPFETIHQHLLQRLPTLDQEPVQRPSRKRKAKKTATVE